MLQVKLVAICSGLVPACPCASAQCQFTLPPNQWLQWQTRCHTKVHSLHSFYFIIVIKKLEDIYCVKNDSASFRKDCRSGYTVYSWLQEYMGAVICGMVSPPLNRHWHTLQIKIGACRGHLKDALILHFGMSFPHSQREPGVGSERASLCQTGPKHSRVINPLRRPGGWRIYTAVSSSIFLWPGGGKQR